MFVSGFNINLQVAVSIQLQLYRELCDKAFNDSHERFAGQVFRQTTR